VHIVICAEIEAGIPTAVPPEEKVPLFVLIHKKIRAKFPKNRGCFL
jgi:hypothetical protein